jgi:molecular chaperone DnaJ
MSVRVRGEGESIGAQGEPGDLYLRLRVEPDPRFKRDGFTIYVTKNIGFTQAALGDTVDVDTVDGPVRMKVPAGTQSGTDFKLSGHGVPHMRGSGRGAHIVTVVVETPTKLSKEQKQLLEEFGESQGHKKGFWR